MQRLVSALLIAVGLIHAYPVIGLLGNDWLATLYGIDASEPTLSVLMRHRAVLLGVLGSLQIAAAFKRALQVPLIVAGLAADIPFVALCLASGTYSEKLSSVFWADIACIAALLICATGIMRERSH